MLPETILDTWRSLDEVILSLTEDQVWGLLAYEQEHAQRKLFVNRLFGRANKLRGIRELKVAMKGTK
jgi:hypothetical protein